MSSVVIIGGGPIGLYLAYKLNKIGIKATVYDPRAGIYTRPGHVNKEDLEKVLQEIGEKISVTQIVHLKDIERTLYEKINYYNIPVEKKSFLRFETRSDQKGIIVGDHEGTEEFVKCNFVFDCTGSKRTVVHAINQLISPPPFTVKPIVPEVNIKNNFIAYVKMSAIDYALISKYEEKTDSFLPDVEDPLIYAETMEKLRDLGWNEMGYPKSYSVDFNKDKICIYMEAPDNLPENKYNAWVETLLRTLTQSNTVSFTQLPASKKYEKKPRFNSFVVHPHMVNEVAYVNKNFPTIILAGDSQIEPNYTLAHGLKSGMQRVDILMEHIEAYKKSIAYFDAEEYAEEIKSSIYEHKNGIEVLYENRKNYFSSWLEQAEKYYTIAINTVGISLDQKLRFEKTLSEIQARLNHKKAQTRLIELQKEQKQGIEKQERTQIILQMEEIRSLLENVLNELPNSFNVEHIAAVNSLNNLAIMMKEMGSHYFKEGLFDEAQNIYAKALAVYQHPKLQKSYPLQELTLYSNLIITKRKLNLRETIPQLALTALEKYAMTPELLAISRKIIGNLVVTIEEQIKKSPESASTLQNTVQKITALHPQLIDKTLENDLKKVNNTVNYFQTFGLFKYIPVEVTTLQEQQKNNLSPIQ